MNLTSALTALLATAEVKQLGPRLARRALAYGLLALAVLCLLVVAWRVLELAFGPLLGPLLAALGLALASAAVMYGAERSQKKHSAPEIASTLALVAPVVVTVAAPLIIPALKYMLHPKRIALLTVLASAGVATGLLAKPSASGRKTAKSSRTSA